MVVKPGCWWKADELMQGLSGEPPEVRVLPAGCGTGRFAAGGTSSCPSDAHRMRQALGAEGCGRGVLELGCAAVRVR